MVEGCQHYGYGCDFKNSILTLVLLIGIFRSSFDDALLLMSQDLTDDQSTMVQVTYWCRKATSHYKSQHWLTLPKWVNRSIRCNSIWENYFPVNTYILRAKYRCTLHSQCHCCWWPGDSIIRGVTWHCMKFSEILQPLHLPDKYTFPLKLWRLNTNHANT